MNIFESLIFYLYLLRILYSAVGCSCILAFKIVPKKKKKKKYIYIYIYIYILIKSNCLDEKVDVAR